MSSQTTIFKLKFSDHLIISESYLAALANFTEEQAKLGTTAKFFFLHNGQLNQSGIEEGSKEVARKDSAYVRMAQIRALQSEGGFYYENGHIYLKIKCRRAFDLNSAYLFYREKGLSTAAFPQDRIDEMSKCYHSIRSLKPLVFTPSYQYGKISENCEAELYQALLDNDFVAKDIFIHCLPGIELECPFYVLFTKFTIKVGGAGEDDQTSDLFYDIVTDNVTRSNGRVEIPKTVDKYFLLKLSDLSQTRSFARFQEIRQKLIYKHPDEKCLFISHNWESPDQPDPYNNQYKELIQFLRDNNSIEFYSQKIKYFVGTRTFMAYEPLQTEHVPVNNFEYVWYDYTCMPQKPRDIDDEKLFREQIINLNNIFRSKLKTIQIGDTIRQKSRSWCVLEQELSKKGGGINMIFESELSDVGMTAQSVDFIYASSIACLKGTQVTNEEDRRITEWMLYKSITDNLISNEDR